MTEADWLNSSDPKLMLDYLRGKTTDRKLRLFACACCYQLWHLLVDSRSRQAVAFAERFVDQQVTLEENNNFAIEWVRSRDAVLKLQYEERKSATTAAARAAFCCCHVDACGGAINAVEAASTSLARTTAQVARSRVIRKKVLAGAATSSRKRLVILLREIFGNPFRPVRVANSQLPANVALLAQTIYDKRSFNQIIEVAEGLEKAGCTDQDILDHCRQRGDHVRGCWVLDLILGKT
jgi:hypothetical protein